MTGSTQGTNGRSEPRPERGRFSSQRKAEAVLRLLHGEELDALSRELGVTAATLAQWRERFLAGGQASLKSRRPMTVTTRSGACRRRSARSRWTTSCCSSARIGWRQDSLWHLGGRGDEPGQLALQRTPLRHGPRLPALGGPAFDGLRAAGASQPARAVCGEARSERRRDGRRPHRADPRRARPLAVHRRGLPQGLGATASGRRAHLEGPGATADAGGGAARPDPRRALPWASEPRRHDHRPDELWGTDATACLTTREGNATVFIAVDHCTQECVGIHAARPGTRFEALEPLRQGLRAHHGGYGPGVAAGLSLRHDHGSQYLSDHFQGELRFLGIRSSPSFVAAPEGNGCAERFIRTLKEQLLWVEPFETVQQLRLALLAFKDRYNQKWLVERHGHRTPAAVRQALSPSTGATA